MSLATVRSVCHPIGASLLLLIPEVFSISGRIDRRKKPLRYSGSRAQQSLFFDESLNRTGLLCTVCVQGVFHR
jgi:hypothetical protein